MTPSHQLSLLVPSANVQVVDEVIAAVYLGRRRLRCRWQVESGGIHSTASIAGSAAQLALVTLHLDTHDSLPRSGASARLRWPQPFETFIDELRQFEEDIARECNTPWPASESDPVLLDEQDVAHDARTRLQFRLSRWPAVDLLLRERYNTRLASFLAARHVSLYELMRLSNVSSKDCESFLRRAFGAGILDVRQQPAGLVQVLPKQAPMTFPPSQPEDRDKEKRSLFAKIRHRLGIAASR